MANWSVEQQEIGCWDYQVAASLYWYNLMGVNLFWSPENTPYTLEGVFVLSTINNTMDMSLPSPLTTISHGLKNAWSIHIVSHTALPGTNISMLPQRKWSNWLSTCTHPQKYPIYGMVERFVKDSEKLSSQGQSAQLDAVLHDATYELNQQFICLLCPY